MSNRALRITIIVAAVILFAVQAMAATAVVHTERNNVHACLPLGKGEVLAGSRGGLMLLDRRGAVTRRWTRANGLPGTAVFALRQDGRRVWVGTERGLVRLDRAGGKLSIDLTVAGAAVRDVVLLRGRLYVATWKGAFSLEAGTSRLVPLPHEGRAPRLTSAVVWDRTVYFGSAGQGLWRLQGGALKPSPLSRGLPSKMVWSLARASDGRLIAGTLGGVVAVDDQGRAAPLSTMDARAILPLGRSTFLAGGYGQGLLRWSRGRLSTEPGQPGARAFVNTVNRSHGTTCVGTRQGLWLSTSRGYRRLLLPGPPSNDISALAADGGRLWVGTFDKGLASIRRGRWQPFRGRGDRLDGRINALAVERRPGGSNLWVATSRGLFRVRGRQVKRFGSQHGLRHQEVHTVIALGRGGALAGTARGAVIVRGETVTVLGVKQGLPVASVWAAAEDASGALWLGTSKGLFRWHPKRRRYQRFSVSSGHLADDYVTALVLHKDVIYAGTYNSGVSMLVKKDDGTLAATQLGGGWVNFGGLRVHAGILYACTMTGLRTIKAGVCATRDGACAWQHRRGAAPGQDVTAVIPKGDRLWVASRRGLASHQNN